jgi:hypothetical protein
MPDEGRGILKANRVTDNTSGVLKSLKLMSMYTFFIEGC